MRVVSKFAVAFFAASLLCFGVFTYVLANREAARLERALAAGLRSYGSGLRPALEATWQEHGYASAERLVLPFDPEGEVRATLRMESGATTLEPSRSETVQDGDRRMVRLRLPIAGPDGARAILTLERSVIDGSTIIRDELGDQVLAAGALAVVMAALAAGLGAIVIGGPLGRIVAQARRIGEGDLSHRLRATGTDEIGTLKRELNAMCDRLVEANARIEEEATARIETLEKLRHLDRLRTVGTIASGIAHELGTPLNVLLLRGQSLARGEIGPSEVADAGTAVVAQVEKMGRIVRQLLEFVRTKGQPKGAGSEVELAAVARHAVSLLGSMAKKHGVTIAVEEKERVTVRGDFGQLEQALTNLIVNGIQAMPDGGHLEVRVGSGPDGRGGVIEVTDHGEGMTEEVRERVFEPFFTTKPTGEGTGLGLHVARGIAEDHGGAIAVRSEPGRGATFALCLPRCA